MPRYRAAARSSKRLRVCGFTAIELMVTIAVLAILVAVAAPSFTPIMERWRLRSAAEDLQSTLHFARSEAIKRGGRVVVQRLPDSAERCAAADNRRWDCGWQVCHDLDDNGQCDAAELVLQRFDAPARLRVERAGGGASIKFNRWGAVAGTWPSFGFQSHASATPEATEHHLCMGSGGRVRVIAATSC